MSRSLALAFALLLLCLPGAAQGSRIFPQLSPKAAVSQTIGTTEVRVDFHRPAVRRRKIWGDLVPFDQVWRAGANEATTIRFGDALRVNGKAVPAGSYALFMIPGQERWTIILNKRWRQLGAYEYDPKEDLLRFEVTPKAVGLSEWLTYEIYPASGSSAYVDMYWEKLRVSFLVEVDVAGIVTARMKKAMAQAKPGDWKIYADAAEYLLEQDADLAQALTWIDHSVRINQNPENLHVKAKLQMLAGQGAEAQKTLEQALKLGRSKGAPPSVTGPLESTQSSWAQTNPGTLKNGPYPSPHRP
jgi:hypothetical protein